MEGNKTFRDIYVPKDLERKPYVCIHCKTRFFSGTNRTAARISYQRHMFECKVATFEQKYCEPPQGRTESKCPHCDKIMRTDKIKDHCERIHSGIVKPPREPVPTHAKCPHCEKVMRKDHIKKHCEAMHSGNKPEKVPTHIKCPYCDDVMRKDNIKRHCANKHPDMPVPKPEFSHGSTSPPEFSHGSTSHEDPVDADPRPKETPEPPQPEPKEIPEVPQPEPKEIPRNEVVILPSLPPSPPPPPRELLTDELRENILNLYDPDEREDMNSDIEIVETLLQSYHRLLKYNRTRAAPATTHPLERIFQKMLESEIIRNELSNVLAPDQVLVAERYA